MRWLVTEQFQALIASQKNEIRCVAVVGGGSGDPEVAWMIRDYPDVSFHYFGVAAAGDLPFTFLDLNQAESAPLAQFDLVHCAQVLEHVWDVKQAIANLSRLARPGGLIWLNCPASCLPHGSPYYFAAGYQPEMLTALGELSGCSALHTQRVGSPRAYFYEHMLRRWPSRAEYESPLRRMSEGRAGAIRAAARWMKYLPGRVMAALLSGEPSDDQSYATQTIVLLRKHD